MLSQSLQDGPQMKNVLLLIYAGHNHVVLVAEDGSKIPSDAMQSMTRWNVMEAFLRPNGILRNS
jgi:hypothetical protein